MVAGCVYTLLRASHLTCVALALDVTRRLSVVHNSTAVAAQFSEIVRRVRSCWAHVWVWVWVWVGLRPADKVLSGWWAGGLCVWPQARLKFDAGGSSLWQWHARLSVGRVDQ